jgi:hypothetical protein
VLRNGRGKENQVFDIFPDFSCRTDVHKSGGKKMFQIIFLSTGCGRQKVWEATQAF